MYADQCHNLMWCFLLCLTVSVHVSLFTWMRGLSDGGKGFYLRNGEECMRASSADRKRFRSKSHSVVLRLEQGYCRSNTFPSEMMCCATLQIAVSEGKITFLTEMHQRTM